MRVTVTDTQGASASDVFDIVVGNVNDGPGQVAPLPAVQHATVGSLFSYTVPDGTFVDVDSGDTLTYTATLGGGMPLPAWLAFVPLTGI